MSQRVIHAGHICPECDNGFVPDGECVACAGTGWVGREVVYVRDGWLYLSASHQWLNTARINAIVARYDDDDASVPDCLGFVLAGGVYDDYFEATAPGDIKAALAWLEGRS